MIASSIKKKKKNKKKIKGEAEEEEREKITLLSLAFRYSGGFLPKEVHKQTILLPLLGQERRGSMG